MRRTLIPIIVLAAVGFTAPGVIAAPAADDHLDIVALTTRPSSADSLEVIPFQVVVNYQLQSVSDGFLLVFAFENNAASSTSQSTANLPIQAGSGQQVFNIDYPLRPGIRTLTLMVAMFKTPQKLLTWVSTTPIDLAPWPGRAEFDKAMAARVAGDYARAESYLSQAIQASPDTGNYYYWRGDNRIYLNQFTAAIADFNRSIDLMPGDVASRMGRGVALLWSGDPEAAINDLSFAIDHTSAPDRLTGYAHRARATAEAALNDPQAAITDYRAYLNIVPDALDRSQVEGWIADLS